MPFGFAQLESESAPPLNKYLTLSQLNNTLSFLIRKMEIIIAHL